MKGWCGAGRLIKLVLVITMTAWMKQHFMDREMSNNIEQEQTEVVVIEECLGATCSFG